MPFSFELILEESFFCQGNLWPLLLSSVYCPHLFNHHYHSHFIFFFFSLEWGKFRAIPLLWILPRLKSIESLPMYLLKQKYSFDSSLFNFPSIYSICENFIYLLFFYFWIFRMILMGKNKKRRWRLKPLLGKRIRKRTIVWFPLLWTKMLFWFMRKRRMLSTNLNQIKPKFLLSSFSSLTTQNILPQGSIPIDRV